MRKQCSKCPWKIDTDPYDIPQGYSEDKHHALSVTVAEPGIFPDSKEPLRIMCCHETLDKPCVGWLVQQLGPGNNLMLRLKVGLGKIDGNVETVGKQHETLEDTFPS